MARFTLYSDAFANGEAIPARHARDGDNVSPPLAWENPPARVKSFALIVEDPDAPFTVFRHWVVYDIPGDWRALPEGLPDGAESVPLREGVNSFGNDHYDGPMPPPLHGVHHYHFRLIALAVPQLKLSPDATADRLWRNARRHVCGEAQLIGTYKRTLAKTLFGKKAKTRESAEAEAPAAARTREHA
ncbi:MAG: YbhB/YbcL family Raf kinase inhibitor-like protein [Gemmatimonas sp.]